MALCSVDSFVASSYMKMSHIQHLNCTAADVSKTICTLDVLPTALIPGWGEVEQVGSSPEDRMEKTVESTDEKQGI